MMALVQRVRRAQVVVDGATVGKIDQGLLVLVCAERGDTEAEAERAIAFIYDTPEMFRLLLEELRQQQPIPEDENVHQFT